MPEPIAEALVFALQAYAAAGVLFAVPFVARGVAAVDPLARSATWGFRLLILPGVVIFWPLLARRWAQGQSEPPVEINAHRRLAGRTP
jgi:hypothetical protein